MELVFAILFIFVIIILVGLWFIDEQVKAIHAIISEQKEMINSPEVSQILNDLKKSGYSITRIDPDSVFIRNRSR